MHMIARRQAANTLSLEFSFMLDKENCRRGTEARLNDLFCSMVSKTVAYEALTA